MHTVRLMEDIVVLQTLVLIFSWVLQYAGSAKVAMKVVEAPVAYGFNNDLISPNVNHGPLVLQVLPRDFSGPEHFRYFRGRCYNMTDEQYLYSFCPFENVTQFETSTRWNAYQGVLGVWQEWKIVNNSFYAMMMLDGDVCGGVHRSVEVTFECNETEGLKEVSEPHKCQYSLIFQTPLVCHADALLVYPRLPETLRRKWDELETELMNQDITEKGYTSGLKRIYVEAGFLRPPKNDKQKVKIEVHKPTDQNITTGLHFENLDQCMKEVSDLQKEIETLRLLLELKSLPGLKNTTGPVQAEK